MSLNTNTNNYCAVPNTITYLFNYNGDIGVNNGFKLHVKKGKNEDSPYFFIVAPIGVLSPRSKAREIFFTLDNIANTHHIDLEKAEILLDLVEINGIDKEHLFKWIFTPKNENMHDEIKEIEDVSLEWKEIITTYYKEKYSILWDSSLNNKQKVDIAAYAIAENCYDEFSAENIARNFKTTLKNAVKRKKTLFSVLSKLL